MDLTSSDPKSQAFLIVKLFFPTECSRVKALGSDDLGLNLNT